jgi:hypothetical protein
MNIRLKKSGMLLPKYFALFFLLFITACEQEKLPDRIELSLNERLNFNGEEYIAYLKHSFKDSVFNLTYGDTLDIFYSERNYNPLFIKSFEDEEFIYSILNLFGAAGEHGIDPEEYYLTDIAEEYLKAVDTSSGNVNRYVHLANTERLNKRCSA